MNIEGITWHAVTTEDTGAWRRFATETLGFEPAMEMDGVVVFAMPNGSILEVYDSSGPALPAFGYNELAYGFRVDDIEQASREIEAAGYELLGEINTYGDYSFRHFRGPDGRVYGLNQQR